MLARVLQFLLMLGVIAVGSIFGPQAPGDTSPMEKPALSKPQYRGFAQAYAQGINATVSSPTPDCGIRWRQVDSLTPQGGGSLEDVAVVSSDDIWAVGNTSPFPGRTLIMHWDGEVWSIVPSPNNGTSSNRLTAVTAISSDDVWAVGYHWLSGNWQTLTLHWDGSEWSIIPSLAQPSTILHGVASTASNDVWAVGHGPNQVIAILHWNGTAWSLVPNAVSGQLRAVTAISPNDVWAVGFTESHRTLTLHWDGSQWSQIPSPNVSGVSNWLYDVAGTASDDVWAVGREGDRTLAMHWDGIEWTITPSPSPGGYSNELYAVTAVAEDDVWAVGRYLTERSVHYTMIQHWDGTAWSVTPAPEPGPNSTLNGAALVSDRDVWAVGFDQDQTFTARYSEPCAVTPTASSTPSSTPSRTPSRTPTSVPSSTSTITPTTLLTNTPGATASSTPTRTLTSTSTATSSPTNTAESTSTRTSTPVITPTTCSISFTDVPTSNTFFEAIHCLACGGIVSGYMDGTFKPNNQVTRGQLAKIVSNSAGLSDTPTQQTFEDVPPTHTFYEWIERLAIRGYMTGYNCGGAGEPCVSGKPYFRPFAKATRGHSAKIVSNATGFTEPPDGQTFEDVTPSHTFYQFIQRLATRNVMGGYPCGGVGEPCLTGKPYFRPGNDVTRGQSAKIVANSFFSECSTR